MIRFIAALAILAYMVFSSFGGSSKSAPVAYTPEKESQQCISQYERTQKFHDDLMYKVNNHIPLDGLGEVNVALIATAMTERMCFTRYIGREMVNMRKDLVPVRKAVAKIYEGS